MNIPWLIVCAAAWVGTGAWWVFSSQGKAIVNRLASRLSVQQAPLAGPFALFAAMAEAVGCAILMVLPPFSVRGHITQLGWALAMVCGVLFVSLQTAGALVVMSKLRGNSALVGQKRETRGQPPASKSEDHESP